MVASQIAPPAPPAWWKLSEPVAHLIRPAAPARSLLSSDSEGEVVEALGRSVSRTGPLDAVAIVSLIASLRPVPRLPRLPMRSFEHPLQVVVDRRTPMTPFLADAERLISALDLLLGARLTITTFSETPLRVGRRFSPSEYEFPEPRSSVVYLSALDVFGETAPWLELQRRSVRAEVTLAALCPYACDRVSRFIRNALPVYYWAPSLSADAMIDLFDARRRLAG